MVEVKKETVISHTFKEQEMVDKLGIKGKFVRMYHHILSETIEVEVQDNNEDYGYKINRIEVKDNDKKAPVKVGWN